VRKIIYASGALSASLLLLSCAKTGNTIKDSEFQERPRKVLSAEVRQSYNPVTDRFEFITCDGDCPRPSAKVEAGNDTQPGEGRATAGVTLQEYSFENNPAVTTAEDTAALKGEVTQEVNTVQTLASESKTTTEADYESVRRQIPFASGANQLGKYGKQAVYEVLPLAIQAQSIYVRGRTDQSGDKELNKQIAISRAYEVKRIIVAGGVDADKVKISYCTTCFIADNATIEGRRLNRRVDIDLTLPQAIAQQLPQDKYQPVLMLTKRLGSDYDV